MTPREAAIYSLMKCGYTMLEAMDILHDVYTEAEDHLKETKIIKLNQNN
jgi:hypothetical protein